MKFHELFDLLSTEKAFSLVSSSVWASVALFGQPHTRSLPPLLHFQMLSTVLNIIIFEDCRNQWSMSRPLLGLILLNEKVGEPAPWCPGHWGKDRHARSGERENAAHLLSMSSSCSEQNTVT